MWNTWSLYVDKTKTGTAIAKSLSTMSTIAHRFALMAAVVVLVACGQQTTAPAPDPTNAFGLDGDDFKDITLAVPSDFVPVIYDTAKRTNEFLLGSEVPSSKDSVFLMIRFPGREPGSFAWGGGKLDGTYTKLTLKKASGQRVEYIPFPNNPQGTTVITTYDTTGIRGTFTGELANSSNGTIRVQIKNGIFQAKLQ
jgi:hypothetical protein